VEKTAPSKVNKSMSDEFLDPVKKALANRVGQWLAESARLLFGVAGLDFRVVIRLVGGCTCGG
jgi:hypothetical protein